MTSHRMAFHSLSKEGIHKITLKGWKNVTEILDVEANGVRIFTFDQKIGPLLKSAWRIMQLVKALSTSDEKTLKQFHQDQMNYTFTQRNDSIVLGLDDNKEDVNSIERRIRSGDLLACHILTGANTFGWYFYGTHISHIVMCLRDENDELFVVETTNANFFPDPQPPWGNGFRKTPFREWMTLYHSHGYAVSLLPLESSLSSSFNSTAAWEWFHSHEKAFSTTAFPFIAIDTPNNNIPTDFTRESLIFFLMLAGHVKPKVVSQHLIEAVNMRLFHIFDERPCHSIEECITTANKLGLDLFDIAAIPEDESWMYQDGPMLVCSTVVANMLRAGGVLGNITFNPTELTPKDILMLNIFDTNPAARISPRCVSTLPVVKPYCQLMGPYVMDVQYYNTITPHDHMFDNCGASPPDWKPYPEGC
ncbi:uncharacterized protein MONOS_3974 [Monocercomonoides exilis]|uniref:uncharacterized protein n=1 Tax=Monocercomonoides exilis TaxID=2049356 RepID=UPI0035599AF9|nr:hypothetical protein MONOS_3974 [Monocercomonoides exilis]|eukprot:MONOS_3974.1-p1 / transcript=MONOS_3974.1 / gene=MONOS_3974 / organism=Monocercomonoides_exilis_PA203 / gene_product=uncharacterized protein / transcript_product=uncharacterized protein / location=Mono_scaffold00099:102474-104557(+) / protein_length=418 / sequence_SO=supercontig / SO=protein_coding / is_pseudo=false